MSRFDLLDLPHRHLSHSPSRSRSRKQHTEPYSTRSRSRSRSPSHSRPRTQETVRPRSRSNSESRGKHRIYRSRSRSKETKSKETRSKGIRSSPSPTRSRSISNEPRRSHKRKIVLIEKITCYAELAQMAKQAGYLLYNHLMPYRDAIRCVLQKSDHKQHIMGSDLIGYRNLTYDDITKRFNEFMISTCGPDLIQHRFERFIELNRNHQCVVMINMGPPSKEFNAYLDSLQVERFRTDREWISSRAMRHGRRDSSSK